MLQKTHPSNPCLNTCNPPTPNNNSFWRSLWLQISSEYLVSMGANLRETEPFNELCSVSGFSVNVVNVSPNLVHLSVSLKSWIRKKNHRLTCGGWPRFTWCPFWLPNCWCFRNPANSPVEVGSLFHYGFYIPGAAGFNIFHYTKYDRWTCSKHII